MRRNKFWTFFCCGHHQQSSDEKWFYKYLNGYIYNRGYQGCGDGGSWYENPQDCYKDAKDYFNKLQKEEYQKVIPYLEDVLVENKNRVHKQAQIVAQLKDPVLPNSASNREAKELGILNGAYNNTKEAIGYFRFLLSLMIAPAESNEAKNAAEILSTRKKV